MKRQILLAFVTMAAGVLAAEMPAHAIPIVGNSTGTLSCTTGTCANVTTSQLTLGTGSPSGWTLTAAPISFNLTGINSNFVSGVQLAELTFFTRNMPSGEATFSYNVALNFTTPSGTAGQNFSLNTSSV